MVRDRKIIVLSVLLAALVIVYVLGSVFTRSGRQRRVHTVPILTPLERETISSFRIEGNTGSVRLRTGEDGSWWIVTEEGNLPASEDKVDRFLETLVNSRTLRFVTEDEDLFADFSVAEARRYVQFFDEGGDMVKRIVISGTGEDAPEGTNQERGPLYVRMQPAERIYQVEDELFFYLRQARNYWADLDLFPRAISPDTVTRADIEGSFVLSDGYEFDGSYTLVRRTEENAEGWEILPSGPEEALTGDGASSTSDAIEGVIISLAELRAFGFAEDQSRSGKGLDDPSGTVRFETEDGSEHRIVLGASASEKESRYLEVSGGPYVYLIKEWAVKRIFKAREELAPKTEA